MIERKKVLVTGGAGSIGSEIVSQLIKYNDIFIIDNNESGFFDIYEELRLKGFKIDGRVADIKQGGVLKDMKQNWGVPDIIFHAAALKHVTPSAWSKEEYVNTNINGTFNVIRFAEAYRCNLVNISTDKVVNPNSIMGASKKVAEIAVRDAGQVSVRFGNVMGSRGSVLEIWQRQINKGERLTVTDEKMERYMMTIPEAVKLVIRAAEIGKPGNIMIMDMGDKVNILSLAQSILQKSEREDIKIQIIGSRPGETLTETLMTEEEKARAIKLENFYVI